MLSALVHQQFCNPSGLKLAFGATAHDVAFILHALEFTVDEIVE